MMKVLITGSSGQLGSELLKTINSGVSEIGCIPGIFIGTQTLGVDVNQLDITDFAAVRSLAEREKFDIIINCAAFTNVDGCETHQETAFKVNALGARNVAIAAEYIGAKLIHISTDYVFSGNSKRPYVEWDCCEPQSVYGSSKLLGEEYVRNFCTKYYIVRTAWLYGYEGNNFVKTMMRLMKENGKVKVVNDQLGNPTNAVDLAYHILKIAQSEQYGIYHCTGKGVCSWYDFACKIAEYSGIPCKVESCTTQEFAQIAKRPAKRPAYSSLDNMMLRCSVGNEMRNWKEALRSFLK